jgi:hopanoid-associated phosphorylase
MWTLWELFICMPRPSRSGVRVLPSSGTIQDGACDMMIEPTCFRRACVAGTTENRPVVAVLGLSFEARIAGGVTVINHGAQTPATLRSVVLQGSRGIISFGLCGGLDPSLRPGQWIVASSVVFGDEIYQSDKRWSDRLIATIPGARYAMVAGVDSAITDFRERLRLHTRTGAVVADMESHVAARIAVEHELPFVACRVVINPAHRKLTSAALLRLRPGGAPDLKGIFRSVLARPSQLLHLTRLAVDASIALSELRQGRLLLGNQLGFPDDAEEEEALVNSQMLASLAPARSS